MPQSHPRLETVEEYELEVRQLEEDLQIKQTAMDDLEKELTGEWEAKEKLQHALHDAQEALHHLEEDHQRTLERNQKLEMELEQALGHSAQLEESVSQLKTTTDELRRYLEQETVERKSAEESLKRAEESRNLEEGSATTMNHRRCHMDSWHANSSQEVRSDGLLLSLDSSPADVHVDELNGRVDELTEECHALKILSKERTLMLSTEEECMQSGREEMETMRGQLSEQSLLLSHIHSEMRQSSEMRRSSIRGKTSTDRADVEEETDVGDKLGCTNSTVWRCLHVSLDCALTGELELQKEEATSGPSLPSPADQFASICREAELTVAENTTAAIVELKNKLVERASYCEQAQAEVAEVAVEDNCGASLLELQQREQLREAEAADHHQALCALQLRLAESESNCEQLREAESQQTPRLRFSIGGSTLAKILEVQLAESKAQCEKLREVESKQTSLLKCALGSSKLAQVSEEGVESLCETLTSLRDHCSHLREQLGESNLLVELQSQELATQQRQFIDLEEQCASAHVSVSDIERASLQLGAQHEEAARQFSESQQWQVSAAELVGAQSEELSILREDLAERDQTCRAAAAAQAQLRLEADLGSVYEEEAVAVALNHLQDREQAEKESFTEMRAASAWRREVDALNFQASYLQAECEELSTEVQTSEAAKLQLEQLASERGNQLQRLQVEVDVVCSHELVELQEELAQRDSAFAAAEVAKRDSAVCHANTLRALEAVSAEKGQEMHSLWRSSADELAEVLEEVAERDSALAAAEVAECDSEVGHASILRALEVASTEKSDELQRLSRSSTEHRTHLETSLEASHKEALTLHAHFTQAVSDCQVLQRSLAEAECWGLDEVSAARAEASVAAVAREEAAAAVTQSRHLQHLLIVREAQLERIQGLMTTVRGGAGAGSHLVSRCDLSLGEGMLGSPFSGEAVLETGRFSPQRDKSNASLQVSSVEDTAVLAPFTPQPRRQPSTPNLSRARSSAASS